MKPGHTHPLILFDGICNLCNGAVRFVIKYDKKKQFHFASLQSTEAKEILKAHSMSGDYMDSFIFIDAGNIYTKSTAALKVARRLGGGMKFLYGLIVFPKFLRDAVYSFIARNRYKWFGKKDECMIPTPELRARFLNN